MLAVVPGDVQAARLAEDIALVGGPPVRVFGSRPLALSPAATVSRELTGRRIAALGAALSGETRVMVAPMEALLPPLPPVSVFRGAAVSLSTGAREDMDGLVSRLVWAGYVREDRVEGPGQFAVRGGLVDVHPVTGEDAVRIEFFGDEIDSMRRFDADTQRASQSVERLVLWPATEAPLTIPALERGVERIRAEMNQALGGSRTARQAGGADVGGGRLPDAP